jgi:hypothetical protein
MGFLFFVSMLLFVIIFTFLWILRLLFLLDYNKSIILELSHFLIVESASLFLFLSRLILISIFFLFIVSGFVGSFVSLIRFIRSISLWTSFVTLFSHLSSSLRLSLCCIFNNICDLILWLLLRNNNS